MINLEVEARTRLGSFNLDAEFHALGGEVTILFGRSGAGKTTVMESIAGLRNLSDGKISLGDRVLFDSCAGVNLKPERRGIGYVFQDARLFPHLTVRENLLYGRRRLTLQPYKGDFNKIIDLLDIASILSRFPSTLSGGEMQRVAIGRAFLSNPDVLLMDEPLVSLDDLRKDEILKYISQLKDIVSIPIIYVTHSVDEVLKLADKVILMSDGNVQASGAPNQVMGRPDLEPFVIDGAVGTVVDTVVDFQDKSHSLTNLAFPGGNLLVPRIDASRGTHIRVRIRSRDVALATVRPESISVLNMLGVKIVSISPPRGAVVDVVLDAKVPLRAQITQKSALELNLNEGMEVFALIKTVAVEGQEHV